MARPHIRFFVSDEIGLTVAGRKEFYDPKDSQEKEIARLQTHFQCLDDTRLSVKGNSQTDQGQIIGISLDKCTGSTACKSSSEVATYLSTRRIALLYNRIRYDPNESGNDSIVRESVLRWIPVTTVLAEQYALSIGRSKVTAQDKVINLGSLTEFEDSSLFSLDAIGFQPVD